MVIVHIANLDDYLWNGVNVVVPNYIKEQSKSCEVMFINVNNMKTSIANQYTYSKPFKIENLPAPFNKPDIVVFQECYRIPYLQIARNLKRNGIPYIIIPHGELGAQAQKKKYIKKKIANLLLFKKFANDALGVQCLSQREYNTTYFGKKKFIVGNGVDIPASKKKEFNSDGINFVYIGRLDPYHKGLDMMIQAVKIKKQYLEKNKCQINIYGPHKKEYYEPLVQMIKEENVGDIIKIYDAVSGKEKEEILLNADVFLQTSRFEGMPLGVLEALSYAIPCMVTEGTTLGNEIQDNNCGWMADNNVNSIAQTFEKVVNDRKLFEKKGENGRQLINDRYSWEVITQDTLNKYNKLLRK